MSAKPKPGLSTGKKPAFAAISFVAFVLLAELVMQFAGMAAARARKPHLRPGARVIVCAGDSHTYGVMVNKEDAYPAQLERLLNREGGNYQVLNLGAPGQNSTQILQAMPEILKSYQPIALVLLVGVNNGWNISGQDQDFMRNLLIKSKVYRLFRLLYFDTVARDKRFLVSRRRDTGEELQNFERPVEAKSDSEFRAIQLRYLADMVQIARLCQDNETKVVLMNYAGDKEFDYATVNAMIRELSEKLRLPLVDNYSHFMSLLYRPDGAFDQELHDQLFLEDMHLKAPGYSIVAENLYQALKQQNIVQ